ncbi:helix-turn-helix domain-containing protein [Bradyrhizobium sp. AUGA SZCCT0160]|uniref:helix-turn-helix domain-containing protein n=1 Tax=Bradyrhizobium sp. AUGA SZCCT0160 TaxID=2807662 RepID=UPI001BA4CF2A|nr:helix-turn-helix domain-containing protein [Bradyrhizobium sp. AUGA SZCCT0160]MBR1191467.1 helix-turn-helix domain-containing protein [Bradyrhizobium sp. AUGA SZCCT0160]
MSKQLEKPKGAMSVNDFARWAGIGRTTAWKEIRKGHLRAVKVSTRTIIRFSDAENWLATRPQLECRGQPSKRFSEW